MVETTAYRCRSAAVKRLLTDLTQQIQAGERKPGEYLPSAHTLAERYGVGYVSVIRIYKVLSDAGLVETVQGRGAFVRTAAVTAQRELTVVVASQSHVSPVSNPHSDWVSQELLSGMNAQTLTQGIRLHLIFADIVGDQWRAVIDGLDRGTCVLFVWEAPPHWVIRLQRAGIPYALVMPMARRVWESEIPSVYPDYYHGVRQAVSAVLHTGRRKPVYLGMTHDAHESGRYQGFDAAVREAGVAASEVISCQDISRAGGRATMEAYLAAHPSPPFDFLVAANDNRALGAIDALQAHGLRIPDDIAVLGFDDNTAAAPAGLSTVKLPIREMGEQSVTWILDLAANRYQQDVPALAIDCPAVWRATTPVRD